MWPFPLAYPFPYPRSAGLQDGSQLASKVIFSGSSSKHDPHKTSYAESGHCSISALATTFSASAFWFQQISALLRLKLHPPVVSLLICSCPSPLYIFTAALQSSSLLVRFNIQVSDAVDGSLLIAQTPTFPPQINHGRGR